MGPHGAAGRSVGVPQLWLERGCTPNLPAPSMDAHWIPSLCAGVRPPTGSFFEPALSLLLRPDCALSLSPILPAPSNL